MTKNTIPPPSFQHTSAIWSVKAMTRHFHLKQICNKSKSCSCINSTKSGWGFYQVLSIVELDRAHAVALPERCLSAEPWSYHQIPGQNGKHTSNSPSLAQCPRNTNTILYKTFWKLWQTNWLQAAALYHQMITLPTSPLTHWLNVSKGQDTVHILLANSNTWEDKRLISSDNIFRKHFIRLTISIFGVLATTVILTNKYYFSHYCIIISNFTSVFQYSGRC